MINDLSICVECGGNTNTVGFVNRIGADLELQNTAPNDRKRILLDAYICGGCVLDELEDIYDPDNDEYMPNFDAREKALEEQITYIDSVQPMAKFWRSLIDNENSCLADVELLWSHEMTHQNSIFITSSIRGDIYEINRLIEAWHLGLAAITDDRCMSFEEYEEIGVEVMYGKRTEEVTINTKLEEISND
tara:strand:+ start:129 stop:698 length:570 start_codon:yes stop_codon:yes gene_type:complete